MANITWTINVENTQHVIRVHADFGGRREIWLDHQLIKHDRKLIDLGSLHYIKVQEEEYELIVIPHGFAYSYYLLRDGLPIPPDQDRQKGITAENLAHMQQLHNPCLLHELGQALNLSYWRQRLIGSVQGYVIVIQKGRSSNTQREGWFVFIRHSRPLSPDIGKKIGADRRIVSLFGGKKFKSDFEHKPDFTGIFLPAKKKETIAEVAARVQTFLAIVTSNTQPVAEDICENPECKQRFVTDRQIVIVNNTPWFFCRNCMGEVSEIGKQAEKIYEAIPNNLLPGFVVGMGITLLGAMIWAAVSLLFNIIAAIVAAGILIWIVREMDRMEVKRSGRSLGLAFLLTIIGVTLGHIATVFFLLIRQGAPVSVQTALDAFNNAIISKPALLFLTYFFAFLGLISVAPTIWLQQRKQLSQAFKPHVEILPQKLCIP
jgi:hypothetical protein